jgi:hypothetical protein
MNATAERVSIYVLLFVATFAILSALWYGDKYRHVTADYARTSLELSNTRAAAETTRVHTIDSVTRVFDKGVIQTPQSADAVDRALRQTRTALDSMRAVIRALSVRTTSTGDVTTATTATGDTVRRATFDVREPPYTARAAVELPARGRGSIDLSVALDTIPLTVRPSCGAADATGIRPARVSVSAPPWATVMLARVEQDPDVCRSPALEQAAADATAKHDRRVRLALVAGYGVTVGTVPVRVGQGAFVGVAFAKPIPLPRWIPFH